MESKHFVFYEIYFLVRKPVDIHSFDTQPTLTYSGNIVVNEHTGKGRKTETDKEVLKIIGNIPSQVIETDTVQSGKYIRKIPNYFKTS